MIVNSEGVTPQQFSDYVNIFTERFRAALGSDLSLEAENIQSELISVESEAFADVDGQGVDIGNNNNPTVASGRWLDDIVSFLGFVRQGATRSTVTATIGGVDQTIIPARSIAETIGGDQFRTTADVTIPPGGSATVQFESVNTGPVPAAANSLRTIITQVLGWNSVDNAASAALGRNEETDTELRDRYNLSLSVNNIGTSDSLRARLLALNGVTDCLILENSTNADVAAAANRGVAVSAHTIASVVEGGNASDIVEVLGRHKPLGIGTSGTSSGTYNHRGGSTTTVDWVAVTRTPVKIVMSINTNAARYPGDGDSRIRQSIVDYFAGVGEFTERGGIGIGDSVNIADLTAAILRVPGFTITTGPTVSLVPSGALAATTPYSTHYFIDTQADEFNITISLT